MKADRYFQELEQVLRESREDVVKREQSTFDKIASPFERELVLFGAGNLGRKALAGLRKAGVEPLAFSDNNESIWGTKIDGIPVLSPMDAIEKHGPKSTFVMTIWRGEGTDRMPDRIAALKQLGAQRIIPFGSLFWKHASEFLPHYALNLPHRVIEQAELVRGGLALFEDEQSRKEYLAQIKWRSVLDFDSLPNPVKHEIYFPNDLFEINKDEVFIDCGAFDGDTIRRFFTNRPDFEGQIKAFEPDPSNNAKLEAYVASLPPERAKLIETFAYAISNKREKVKFSGTGTEAASVGSGDIEVDAAPLDEVLAHCAPTYLKMDTEGSELDGVTGAQNILRKHAPALALCVYHRQDHLWKVPLEVRKYSDEYAFFLRPHLLEVWDLVMYGVPKNRLKRT
jgi:FkbM family methyltransferase